MGKLSKETRRVLMGLTENTPSVERSGEFWLAIAALELDAEPTVPAEVKYHCKFYPDGPCPLPNVHCSAPDCMVPTQDAQPAEPERGDFADDLAHYRQPAPAQDKACEHYIIAEYLRIDMDQVFLCTRCGTPLRLTEVGVEVRP